jgi:hypothetical protein
VPSGGQPDAQTQNNGVISDPPIVNDDSYQWDGGVNHFVGYWRYLPGNPTNCKLKIANVPAAITPLVFSDCPSKRVGCRKLEITWTQNIYDALDFLGPEPVRRIGNRAYVLVQRKWPRDLPMQHTGATDALMTTIEEVDGQVTFATGIIMAPPPFNVCVYDMSYSDDGVAIHALPRPYQSWDIFAWHAWPPSPEVTSETFPHWKLGNGCDYCTSLEPSCVDAALPVLGSARPRLFQHRESHLERPGLRWFRPHRHAVGEGRMDFDLVGRRASRDRSRTLRRLHHSARSARESNYRFSRGSDGWRSARVDGG